MNSKLVMFIAVVIIIQVKAEIKHGL